MSLERQKTVNLHQPLLLFKCFLLQKWFQIKSDPELESQINDRISFKVFLRIPVDTLSPDAVYQYDILEEMRTFPKSGWVYATCCSKTVLLGRAPNRSVVVSLKEICHEMRWAYREHYVDLL